MEQLRATLHSDLQEKNDILDKLTNERGKSSVFLLRTKGLWPRSCYFLSVSVFYAVPRVRRKATDRAS